MESLINSEKINKEVNITQNNLLVENSPGKYFQKLSKNVFSCLLQFSSYSEFPRFMLINKFFVSNIKYFLKYKVDKDTNLLDFYRKHIFLFNEKCLKLFKLDILPYIHTNYIDDINDGLYSMFENESLILKQFIYNLEEEINNDLQLIKHFAKDKSTHYEKLRQNILFFISKLISDVINKRSIKELDFQESKIGREGSKIISLLLKQCNKLEYLDFSYSLFSEDELLIILNSIEKLSDFLSFNLSGVNISLNNLKFIKVIQKLNPKIQIDIGDNSLIKMSKITAVNNKRGCNKKKKKK